MFKVSVIVPAFNRPKSLLAAVESVVNQSYQNFELIVVDDGSTEDLSSVQKFVSAAGYRFLTLEKNLGVSVARNYAAKESLGEWLAFLDSDDLWLPTKLEKQLAFLQAQSDCEISQCEEIWYRNNVFVNPKNCHAMPDGEAFAASLKRCCISPSAVILKRTLFMEYGGFDENLRVCEDYDLWLRITADHRVPLLREKLVKKFGGHKDQLSKSMSAMDRFRVYALLKLLLERKLNDSQRKLVCDELLSKSTVLFSGARKRGNFESEQRFQSLIAEVSTVEDFASLKSDFLQQRFRESKAIIDSCEF